MNEQIDRLVVRPREARRMLDVSQKKLYKMIKERKIESFLDGGSRKITVESIRAYVRRGLETSK